MIRRWWSARRGKKLIKAKFDRFAAQFGTDFRLVTEPGGVLALVITLPVMTIREFNRRYPRYTRPEEDGEITPTFITPTFRDEVFNPRALTSEEKKRLIEGHDYIRGVLDEWRKEQC